MEGDGMNLSLQRAGGAEFKRIEMECTVFVRGNKISVGRSVIISEKLIKGQGFMSFL